jgi:hypothetical protein
MQTSLPLTAGTDELARATSIVERHFSNGLARICEPKFLSARYREFQNKADPIYSELLDGMNDEKLAATFVSYWTIAHTIATQSRFWLEAAIADILIEQAIAAGDLQRRVYSHSMLSAGLLDQGITVADLGEWRREHVSARSPWEVYLQEGTLREIDIRVGIEERNRRTHRDPLYRRLKPTFSPEEVAEDRASLDAVASSFSGPPTTRVKLQCNLLVIEPSQDDRQPHAWGIRFINPKTFSSHATRKQERVNLLRLYGYLVQEKILRDPYQIEVRVAEILPREQEFSARDKYPYYFTSATHWPPWDFWKFVGVPFDVVTTGIQRVAAQFRTQLAEGLRNLLPTMDDVPAGAPQPRKADRR